MTGERVNTERLHEQSEYSLGLVTMRFTDLQEAGLNQEMVDRAQGHTTDITLLKQQQEMHKDAIPISTRGEVTIYRYFAVTQRSP